MTARGALVKITILIVVGEVYSKFHTAFMQKIDLLNKSIQVQLSANQVIG